MAVHKTFSLNWILRSGLATSGRIPQNGFITSKNLTEEKIEDIIISRPSIGSINMLIDHLLPIASQRMNGFRLKRGHSGEEWTRVTDSMVKDSASTGRPLSRL